MIFIKDTTKEQIVNAILSHQTNIVIDRVEIILKPLKRDTSYYRNISANKQADKIIKAINS
jgi:hypothetical protein